MDHMAPEVAALLSPPDIMGCKKVLCIQPHPDDNEIGMGGIIAKLAQAGCEIHYLTVTNGDMGNKNSNATPEETAAIRHNETIAAGKHLGASAFHFLDHGDGTLEQALPLSVEIASVIRKVQPQAIFAPDPWLNYECHLDHTVTGRAAANAFLMAGRAHFPDGGETKPCPLQAIGFYFTAKPNTVVDITDTFERKFEAIALHDSQMDPQTLGLYRIWFGLMGQELAAGKGFALGEGLKVLSQLHAHCFVKTEMI